MEKPHHDIRPTRPAPKRTDLRVPTYISDARPISPDAPRWLVLTLQILAYGIPLTFLAYVLYINYLPFGYNKTFTIDVGAEGDTTVGEFYLEPSPDLSERKTAPDGTTYRELNGMANVVFKPNVVLKDAEITVSVEGEGVSIIPPVIDFNPDDYEWDYEWDFTKPETAFTPKVSDRARADWVSCTTTASTTGTGATTTEMGTSSISEGTEEFVPVPISENATTTATSTQVCTPIPVPDLVGNAFFFDGEMYFDGNSRLEMPGTADMFEETFSVYAEWTPQNNSNDFQEVAGHYNWELLQDNEYVTFQVGRTASSSGPFYRLQHKISEDFFNERHSALAIYYSGIQTTEENYIELYIDNKFIGKTFFNEKIWNEYNKDRGLSFGKSGHSDTSFLNGKVKQVIISHSIPYFKSPQTTFISSDMEQRFFIEADGTHKLNGIKLNTIN
jgi:hypothetical protein